MDRLGSGAVALPKSDKVLAKILKKSIELEVSDTKVVLSFMTFTELPQKNPFINILG